MIDNKNISFTGPSLCSNLEFCKSDYNAAPSQCL